LLDDRELAQRLGGVAQQRQRAEYDFEVVLHRLEQLYVEQYERVRGPRR
jgi:hypothetical protein